MSQASAKADLITFEFDPIQTQLPNGFRSVESNLVRFSAFRLNTLHIHPAAFGFGQMVFFGTRGLASEDERGIFMDFDVPVTSLSLWFGNDHFGDTFEGDTAILQTFLDGVFVGETTVLLNRDDIINQQILFAGAVFNRATFTFSNTDIVKTVDNIEFTPVPEPTTVALLGIGIVGLIAKIRRRN
ncbi:MAG TPA: PEP-CTERM sorting domain-containing protein [Pyrinomonadaceae bacterium]|nr:PEP-CTERM sorting domain-containing protein [Pyrinomonadaceae bacterium]